MDDCLFCGYGDGELAPLPHKHVIVLKYCPFCGHQQRHDGLLPRNAITCESCGATGPTVESNQFADKAKAWNR